MPDPLSQLLHDWQNFYLLTGTAAATLIGLQFVAASLGVGVITSDTRLIMNTWITPTIIHFGSVLLLAVISTIPSVAGPLLAIALIIAGLIGLGYTVLVAMGMKQQGHSLTVPSILIWYIVTPFVSYAIIVGVAIGLLINLVPIFNILSLAIILLLILGIRNAWDLTMWITQNRR